MNIAKYKIFVPETSGAINKKSLRIANVLFLELTNYSNLKRIVSVSGKKNYITMGKLAEILSGKDKAVDLTITNNVVDKNEINPESLSSLFANKTKNMNFAKFKELEKYANLIDLIRKNDSIG